MSKAIFNAIFCGALFVTGLPTSWAQSSSLPSCAFEVDWATGKSKRKQDWHMCRHKEDLGGGVVINHEYRSGVPYFASGRPYPEGTFSLLDKFSLSKELQLGPLDMSGGRVYIDLPGLNVNGTKRIFGVLFDFPYGYAMSSLTSMKSFLGKMTADCSAQKIMLAEASGFYGVMAEGDPTPMESEGFEGKSIAMKDLEVSDLPEVFKSDVVRVFKSVMGSVCAPDILTQVNSARIERLRAEAAEAQRQDNERKAAQLEEDRKRLEEDKRQIALKRQRIEGQKGQPQVAPDNRRRLALVIGNDNYSSMPRLNNAVNDARSMSDALRQANFEVMSFSNLDKRRMEEALYNFAQKLGKDDVGMFYFAGHGVQANNKNFLIPVGENVKRSADVQFESIDVNRVMAYLQDSKNSLNIVVLDACRSSLPERGGMSRGLTVTEAPQGSIVAYATRVRQLTAPCQIGRAHV